jgi:hypothetical protein
MVGVKVCRGAPSAARNYLEADRSRADDYYLAEGTGVTRRFTAGPDAPVVELTSLAGDGYEAWVAGLDPDTGERRGDASAMRFAAGKWRGLDTIAFRDSIQAINGIGHAAVACDPDFRAALAAHGTVSARTVRSSSSRRSSARSPSARRRSRRNRRARGLEASNCRGCGGAPRGNRTPNPLIKSQLLCQLS